MIEHDLKNSCYHEAGHAAVGMYYEMPIISMTARMCIKYSGNMAYFLGGRVKMRARTTETYEEVEMLLAGPTAAAKYSGRWDAVGASDDLKQARCETDAFGGGYYYDQLKVCAKQRVNELWPQIEALAIALEDNERLLYRKARAIYNAASQT